MAAAIRRIPVHVVVIAVAVIWAVPLLGLVVSAFRPSWAVLSSGWWESFALPATTRWRTTGGCWTATGWR